jgi:hypothetical protein
MTPPLTVYEWRKSSGRWARSSPPVVNRCHIPRPASPCYPIPQNPFYELEMPIRIKLFDHALEAYTRSTGLGNPAPR